MCPCWDNSSGIFIFFAKDELNYRLISLIYSSRINLLFKALRKFNNATKTGNKCIWTRVFTERQSPECDVIILKKNADTVRGSKRSNDIMRREREWLKQDARLWEREWDWEIPWQRVHAGICCGHECCVWEIDHVCVREKESINPHRFLLETYKKSKTQLRGQISLKWLIRASSGPH